MEKDNNLCKRTLSEIENTKKKIRKRSQTASSSPCLGVCLGKTLFLSVFVFCSLCVPCAAASHTNSVRIIYTNAYLAVHKPKQAKIQTSVSKEKAVSFLNLEEKMEENKIEKTNHINDQSSSLIIINLIDHINPKNQT